MNKLVIVLAVLCASLARPQEITWTPQVFTAPGTTLTRNAVLVKVTPIYFTAARKALGKGKALGQWRVDVCHVSGTDVIASTLVLAPSVIPFVPNDFAADVIGRQVANDPQSVISNNGNTVISLTSTLMTGLGIATKSPNTVYAAAALGVAQLIVNVATHKAPSATSYLARLVPETIMLAPGTCGQWYAFSGLMKDPAVSVWIVRY